MFLHALKLDNESTDSSIKIAKNFDSNIEIIRFCTNGEYREDLMIDIRNNCWKDSKADYVIICDMDEFLYDENILDKLIYAKEREIKIPIVLGYNMMSLDFPRDYKSSIIEQVKNGIRDRMFDKSIIFNPKQIKNINFGPGSHSCNPEFYSDVVEDELLELKLLHFKYLDREYLYEKHKNYDNRMSIINKEKRYGHEYLLGNDFVDKVFSMSHYLLKVIK